MALPRRAIGSRVWISVLAPALSLGALIAARTVGGAEPGPVGIEWMPSLQLSWSFNPDPLGWFFAMLVAGIGIPITLYARAYFGPDQNALYRIYPSLMLFMTGMLGLVLADDFILLLLFWEITSVSSFLLIGWEREDSAAVRNALQAFIITGAGGMALMGGLILLGITAGTWSFSSLEGLTLSGKAVSAAFILIFIGAAAKSAQWPLHFWLPDAMAAPTPVSAYLHSATMVKAGVYLLARLSGTLSQLDLWSWLLVPIGVITMVIGAYIALRKTDLKLIFAYTTVSQLGLLISMYGLAALGGDKPTVLWDLTQIFNHAVYKAPLFILAGAIAHVWFTRDVRDLCGLFYQGRTERRLAIMLLLATYSMASGPFTLGFISKEFFLYGAYNAYQATGQLLPLCVLAGVVVQGAINVAIFVRFALTLLGPESYAEYQSPHDPEAEEERIAYEDYHAIQSPFWTSMLWVPAAILIAIQLIGGMFPALLNPLARIVERNQVGFDHLPSVWHAFTHPSVPLALSMLSIVSGAALAVIPTLLAHGPVWRSAIHDWHDGLFDWFYNLATKSGGKLFAILQTGNLRTYIGIVCATLVGLCVWGMAYTGAWPSITLEDIAKTQWSRRVPEFAIGSIIVIAAVLLPFIHHRAGRIMLLGTVGYGVAGIFYCYAAPDVALTQVSIEIVGMILFLLALGLLPRTMPARRESVAPILRLVIAIAAGVVMACLTIASSMQDRPTMSYVSANGDTYAHPGEFYIRNAYEGQDVEGRHPGGGGKNVVNVILVDFRGLDTFGEITVLGIAALGVIVLLKRKARRTSGSGRRVHLPLHHERPALSRPAISRMVRSRGEHSWMHGYSLTSEPLRVATKLIVPLGLLFALFIFLKGHHSPGGGFVAGLVGAMALIAHRMAHGRTSLRHMMLVTERKMIGIGLMLVLGAGLSPMVLSRPFLTSRYGYFTIPGVDRPLEWTTALVFDLGVGMVVLGVVLAMINALSTESEAR